MSPMIKRAFSMELALLGFLRHKPLHGYQIYQQLGRPDDLGLVWRLKQAQLYALLGKLEEAGLIASSLEQKGGRPARHVFHLTPAGEKVFEDWLGSAVATPRQMRQEFQAKLYFARLEGTQETRRLLTLQQATCRHWLENQQKRVQGEAESSSFRRILDEYRLGQMQATLTWLEAILAEIPAAEK
jgi:PadR family transcriptional regulator, regulatory protein AphA